MMKQLLLLLTLLATTSAALAQTICPPPVVKVLRDTQEIPATGAAFAPKVTLLVSPAPACATPTTFRFREAEVTLMRGSRPALPTLLVKRPDIDLTDLTSVARPGDRIHVFIWYKNLYVASAVGKLRPYPRPALSPTEQKGISANLVTDEAKGISFNWLVL